MSAKMLGEIPVPDRKPSITEIAEMPYPHSLAAMRKFYNSEWGKPIPEGADKPRKFKVTVNFSYREESSKTYDIEAFCEKEAEALGEKAFDDDPHNRWIDDCDIRDIEVEEEEDA